MKPFVVSFTVLLMVLSLPFDLGADCQKDRRNCAAQCSNMAAEDMPSCLDKCGVLFVCDDPTSKTPERPSRVSPEIPADQGPTSSPPGIETE